MFANITSAQNRIIPIQLKEFFRRKWFTSKDETIPNRDIFWYYNIASALEFYHVVISRSYCADQNKTTLVCVPSISYIFSVIEAFHSWTRNILSELFGISVSNFGLSKKSIFGKWAPSWCRRHTTSASVTYCFHLFSSVFCLFVLYCFTSTMFSTSSKSCKMLRIFGQDWKGLIQGRNKVYEIRDHSPRIWDHNTWDRDQQCFCGIRDQNCERFWDQGSKFPMFLWSGIKILNVFVIRDQNLGQKYRIS